MNFVAAILYAVSASSLLAVLLGFLRGGLDRSSAALAIGCGLLVASFALWQSRDSRSHSRRLSVLEWLAIVAFALVSLRILLWVVYASGDEIRVLSDNNLGDFPLHLTYVRFLANGTPFWPDNPIFTHAPLTYPIGVDLFHSLFVLLGLNVFRGFIWIGLGGAALTGFALWRWGRGFALFGFLANGGLAGLEIFRTSKLADFQSALAWKSIALAIFATQRGFLFALPAGLLLLSSWRARFFQVDPDQSAKPPSEDQPSADLPAPIDLTPENSASEATAPSPPSPETTTHHPPPNKPWHLPLWGEILLYASLPLFHFHTFLFLSVLLGVWFIFYSPARLKVLAVVGVSFVPATILVYLITGGLHGGNMLGWKPGWMWDDDSFLKWCQAHWPMNPYSMVGLNLGFRTLTITPDNQPFWVARLIFWPLNFGPLLIYVAVLIAKLCRPQSTPWPRLAVFPALGIFLLCCFVMFAPNEWDNTKLMMWSYLVLLPFLWSEILVSWPLWGQTVAFIALFFSGFVSTLGGIDAAQPGQVIANRSELDGVAHGLHGIPITERFAGQPTYNHPLLLNGRKMVLGYVGHVVSHGLDWDLYAKKLDALMNGDPAWQAIATDLGARYLFWGPREQEAYPDSTQPWRQSARLISTGDWGEIYDLQSAPTIPPGLPDLKE